MKYIFFLLVSLFISSCSGGNDDNTSITPEVPTIPEKPENPEPEPPAEESMADQSLKYFNQHFLVQTDDLTYYKEVLNGPAKDKLYFWEQALCILMLEDSQDARPANEKKELISKLLTTFLIQNQGKGGLYDWTWNKYNDDLLWAGLAFIRGYQITNDKEFLDQAVYAYNLLYGRGYDDVLGGGIWWSTDKKEKSALSNSPAASMAAYLYEATNEEKYKTQAIDIYDWIYKTLFDEKGGVHEKISKDGKLESSTTVYSSGAFIEAANALHRITKDAKYVEHGKLAVKYVKETRTTSGVISKAHNGGTWQSEFARGLFMLVRDNNLWEEYYDWMKLNALIAWRNRNLAYNITFNEWVKQTVSKNYKPTEVVSACVMIQVTPDEKPEQ